MPLYRRGFDVEDRIATLLERSGFTVKRDPVLDHKFKLDLVVLSFPENLSHTALGMQICTRPDDLDKMEEFWNTNQTSTKVPKSLYLEIRDTVDLDSGGGALVVAAVMNCQFNREYQEQRVVGAAIYEDLTYGFFEFPARIQELRERRREFVARTTPAPADSVERLREKWAHGPGLPLAAAAAQAAGANGTVLAANEHQGVFTDYLRDQGFGFIHDNSGLTFYAHINKVLDEELREQLNSVPFGVGRASFEIPVTFHDAGRTRPNAKYPEAIQIRLRR